MIISMDLSNEQIKLLIKALGDQRTALRIRIQELRMNGAPDMFVERFENQIEWSLGISRQIRPQLEEMKNEI